jgi:hypothetical protein
MHCVAGCRCLPQTLSSFINFIEPQWQKKLVSLLLNYIIVYIVLDYACFNVWYNAYLQFWSLCKWGKATKIFEEEHVRLSGLPFNLTKKNLMTKKMKNGSLRSRKSQYFCFIEQNFRNLTEILSNFRQLIENFPKFSN